MNVREIADRIVNPTCENRFIYIASALRLLQQQNDDMKKPAPTQAGRLTAVKSRQCEACGSTIMVLSNGLEVCTNTNCPGNPLTDPLPPLPGEQKAEIRVAIPLQPAQLLFMVGMVDSIGEGIRKVKEGAVKINGETVRDYEKSWVFGEPAELRLGNKKLATIVPDYPIAQADKPPTHSMSDIPRGSIAGPEEFPGSDFDPPVESFVTGMTTEPLPTIETPEAIDPSKIAREVWETASDICASVGNGTLAERRRVASRITLLVEHRKAKIESAARAKAIEECITMSYARGDVVTAISGMIELLKNSHPPQEARTT